MQTITTGIGQADWPQMRSELHEKGYAVLEQVLSDAECEALKAAYEEPQHYRKTISMERYRFGAGEYKYFAYPLPPLLQSLRESAYRQLVPVANEWMTRLGTGISYPATLAELHELCREQGQDKPAVLILRYGRGGHNTLHQDLYGDVFFPIQMVLFLSEPEADYGGGHFVLLEQRPRAQSKATVLRPRKGDALVFTTSFRAAKGSKGYYRAPMKHGVSEVLDGSRYTLGLIFHDAP